MWAYDLWGLSVMIQICENHMAIIPGCMQNVLTPSITWHSVGPAFCWSHRDAVSCGRMMPSLTLTWHLFLILVCCFEVSHSNGLQRLCCYVIWSPEIGIPQCPPGPVCIYLPPGTPSLRYAVMLCIPATHSLNCTVFHKCLPGWSQSQSPT